MGAKPAIQLPPFEITRNEVHSYVPKTVVGPIYAHIYSHMIRWYRLGSKFDLPVFNKEGASESSLGSLDQLLIKNNNYRCRVKYILQLDNNVILLRLKVKKKGR